MTAPTPGFKWTPERCALLTQRWMVDRRSSAEIAAELGLKTRNAVIGKVNRLGLRREGRQVPMPRIAGAVVPPPPRPVKAVAPVPPAEPLPKPKKVDLSATALNPVPFLDRRPDQCCFPLWPDVPGRLVCGDPTATPKLSWCPAHLRIVSSPASKGDRL